MIMRMIWGFLDKNVCHDLRLMHASTSSHFPLLAQRNWRVGKCSAEKRSGNLFLGDLGSIYAGALHSSANMFKPV